MRFRYHAFSDELGINSCSVRSDEAPLIVNCAGNISSDKPFVTYNAAGREDFYFIYMIKGSITLPMNGDVRVATGGDVLLFPPHYRYRYSYDGKEPLEYMFVHFTGSYADALLERLGLSPLPSLYKTDGDRRITDVFRSLLEATVDTSEYQKYELAALLEMGLVLVAARFAKRAQSRTLERSLNIMHTAYHSDIRIPDLARVENLSHSRYVEIFKKQTGTSPMSYLVNLRIRAACNLLESTDIQIGQICRMVGYDDMRFFSKLFKKHIGISPTEYRRKRI